MKVSKIIKVSLIACGSLFVLAFGYHYLPIQYKLPIREQVKPLLAKIDYLKYSYNDGQDAVFTNFNGKNILVIGDSQTSTYQWQTYLGCLINANIDTHAMGGIGMLAMVDGDIQPNKVKGVDPNNFGVDHIFPLNKNDVKNMDYIIIMGLYNENRNFENHYGHLSDLYPQKDTYCGTFNYMIKRVREVLMKSNNKNCDIILAGPHLFGKYPYNDNDAYHYVGLSDSLNSLCNYNHIKFCDLRKLAGIDSTNWNVYQNGDYVTTDPRANPKIKDNLHLNKRGQMKVAIAIAKWIGIAYRGR